MLTKSLHIIVCLLISLGASACSLLQTSENRPSKISGAYEALQYWSDQRAYPNKIIPEVGHYAAFEYSKLSLRRPRFGKSQSVAPWVSIGPYNMGGRTLAVAFDPRNPDVIYAGSASGGLWRSTTGGMGPDAWQIVPTGFPVLAVSSIAVDPGKSDIIYIGTGEVYNYQNAEVLGAANRAMRGSYGIGVLKTTDGGVTWAKSLDWSANQRRGVQAVKIDPQNSSIVWAATTEGVFKSTDAGVTWSQMLDVVMAMDLVINPTDPDVVIASCGNFSSPARGLYQTTDGGMNWSRRYRVLAGKAMLAISEASPNVVYASIANGFAGSDAITWLAQSLDSGATWKIISNADYAKWQGWFSHDIAVNPQDPSEVFAVGIQVWRSRSGGTELAERSVFNPFQGPVPPGDPEGPPNYTHSDTHDVVYHPTNPSIVYFATDGGVFRTTDGGETFEGCNGGYQTVQFYNGFSISPDYSDFAMGGLQDNNTIIYRGSTTWSKFHIGGDGSWTAIDPRNNGVLYGSAQYLQMFKSWDDGQNWERIVPGADDGRVTSFVAPFVLSPSEPDILYAGRDLIYKSTDGGVNWTVTNGGVPLDGNPMLSMAISRSNSNVVYAASAPRFRRGGIFRTNDGGATWVNITRNLPDRYPTDLIVDWTNDATVYVTFSGFGTSHVFKSEDGGDSWRDIGSSLPDLPTNALAIDPQFSDHLYVGNDLGVYASTDGGGTWMEFSDGLPEAVIAFDLGVSLSNRRLRVATHGNGAFERELIGNR